MRLGISFHYPDEILEGLIAGTWIKDFPCSDHFENYRLPRQLVAILAGGRLELEWNFRWQTFFRNR